MLMREWRFSRKYKRFFLCAIEWPNCQWSCKYTIHKNTVCNYTSVICLQFVFLFAPTRLTNIRHQKIWLWSHVLFMQIIAKFIEIKEIIKFWQCFWMIKERKGRKTILDKIETDFSCHFQRTIVRLRCCKLF